MRKVAENTYLVAENDDAQILFYEPERPVRSIVTFNDMTTFANGVDFWASDPCKKLRYRALGVMSRRADWFPTSSIGPLIDEAVSKDLLDRPIAYGFSMGGHAALKFGRKLNVTYAVALSPQWSIAPNLAPVSLSGYSGNFRPGTREEDVTIYADQMPEVSYCVYDSRFGQDNWNTNEIRKLGRPHVIDVRYMEHFTILAVSSSARLAELFQAADSGNTAEIAENFRRWKKKTVYYLGQMGIATARNHTSWSAAIFDRLFEIKPGASAKRFKFEAVIDHGTEQDVCDEIDALTSDELQTESLRRYILYMLDRRGLTRAHEKIVHKMPVEAIPRAERWEYLNKMLQGNEFDRLASLTNLMLKEGDNADKAYYLRSVALLKLGFEDASELAAEAALKQFPTSLPLALFLSNLMVSRKQLTEAFALAENQLVAHPHHPSLLNHLAYVAKNMGNLDKAHIFASKVLDADPNNEAARIMLAT